MLASSRDKSWGEDRALLCRLAQNRARTLLFIRLKQYLLARGRAVKVVIRGARQRTICALDCDESMDTPEHIIGGRRDRVA
jgi:hypothetical protein